MAIEEKEFSIGGKRRAVLVGSYIYPRAGYVHVNWLGPLVAALVETNAEILIASI